MDPRLIEHYKRELAHLNDMGAEFAREFPRIAARLAMDAGEVRDPYVERLLEGFALMAARIQVKLDAQYPSFVQALLQVAYPEFLAPLPSAAVARFVPDDRHPALATGMRLRRGSRLLSGVARGAGTSCEFRTAHEVELWPIQISSVRYTSGVSDLPGAPFAGGARPRASVRIRLQASEGLTFAQLPIERLPFFVSAPAETGFRLHELLAGASVATALTWVENQSVRTRWDASAGVRPEGFEDDQALLPATLAGYAGHRLLQEYAMLPERFLFVSVGNLAARLASVNAAECEVVIALSRAAPEIEARLDAESLALFCTPAVNLFSKSVDNVRIKPSVWEYPVVGSATHPIDYEIHSIESMTTSGSGARGRLVLHPLYSSFHTEPADHRAYYTVRRDPYPLSARDRRQGFRSSYTGQQVYVSIVDPRSAPFDEELRELSIRALVTNRDLPLLVPSGPSAVWTLDEVAPVERTVLVRGPSRPRSRLVEGDAAWSLVSQLGTNYLGLAAGDPSEAASALRQTLMLYGTADEPAYKRQVDALLSLESRRVVRRLPFTGPLAFGTGVSVTATVDDAAFEGGSAYVFGAVLDRWIARHAAINSFTEFSMSSPRHAEPWRWAPRAGARPLL